MAGIDKSKLLHYNDVGKREQMFLKAKYIRDKSFLVNHRSFLRERK